MNFKETPFDGLWIVDTKKIIDERGVFFRTYCEDSFSKIVIPSASDKSSFSLPGPEKSILLIIILTSVFSPWAISLGPVCEIVISSVLIMEYNKTPIKLMKIKIDLSINYILIYTNLPLRSHVLA